jgi:hypothetical protein
VDVRIDKSRCNELAFGIDGLVDLAVEAFANMYNLVALIDHDAVTDEGMPAPAMADDPAAIDGNAHGVSLSLFQPQLRIRARARALTRT